MMRKKGFSRGIRDPRPSNQPLLAAGDFRFPATPKVPCLTRKWQCQQAGRVDILPT
jgi:hypothetical protein